MGTLYNPPFTVEDAIARGHDVFEVVFTNWGISPNNPPTVLADFTNLQYPQPGNPGLPATLAGIAIGPKSTVDRAWVTFNLGKRADVTQPVDGYNLIREVSVTSPLVFTQASNPNQSNNPLDPDDPVKTLTEKGALYVFPFVDRPNTPPPGGSAVQIINPGSSLATPRNDSTVLPKRYRDANGTLHNFRNSLVPSLTAPVFVPPTLHLVCYLKNPYHYPPTARAPLQYRGQGAIEANGLDLTPPEKLIVSLPTFGRRRIAIEMHMNANSNPAEVGNANFRAGGIISMGQLEEIQEVTLASQTNVAPGVPALLDINVQGVDYLNLYAACPIANTFINFGLNYAIAAYD